MFYQICTVLLLCHLSASVLSKPTINTNEADRQPYPLDAACEDQLIKYRKFIMQTLINSADVCNNFDMELNEEQHAELVNYLRLLVQRLTDKQIEEAVLENCNQKSQAVKQQQVKREYVVLGKKQRFHSWGGKRAENTHNEPASLYFL